MEDWCSRIEAPLHDHNTAGCSFLTTKKYRRGDLYLELQTLTRCFSAFHKYLQQTGCPDIGSCLPEDAGRLRMRIRIIH
jgi:hypothetical protein